MKNKYNKILVFLTKKVNILADFFRNLLELQKKQLILLPLGGN